MRDRPAIEMPRLEIERHHRAAVGGADELDAELFDKGDIESKCARVESQETVPCAAGACQSNDETTRRAVAGTMTAMMTAGTASVLRFAAMLLATLLLGISAAWGAVALWYQAPGSRLKTAHCAAVERIRAGRTDCALAGPRRTRLLELRRCLRTTAYLVAAHHTHQRAPLGGRCRANHPWQRRRQPRDAAKCPQLRLAQQQ